ncbi:MAG: hypothetical protein IV092_19020 [Burkholderiaceae bacterium]|nr:hypothetical protein [Burkholderiaceae bacterium]
MAANRSKSAAALCRQLGWCAFVWLGFGSAQAKDISCKPAANKDKPRYSVACGGKSECQANDVLEIKPLEASAPPLTAVCLRVDGAGPAAADKLDTYPDAASAVPLTYALAPRLHAWQRDPALGPELPAAKGGRLFLTAVLTDKNRSYNAPFSIDLTSLWTAGTLQLQVPAPQCEPCTFDGEVKLTVPNLANWKQATKGDPAKLALTVSGIKLAGVPPEVAASGVDGTLTYRLRRVTGNSDNEAAWAAIIKRALGGNSQFHAGLADDKGELATAGVTNSFEVLAAPKRAFATLLVIFIVAAMVWAIGSARGWSWLRDSYDIPEALLPAHQRTLSLGRCQMFWWTLVILVAWGTIAHATGNWFSINDSALILMGISVGTAVGAVQASPPRVVELVRKLNEAQAAVASAPADPAAATALAAAEAAISGDPQLKTGGPLKDLLSDVDQGAGLHRLQNVMFTIGLGIAYVWLAFHEGSMPTLPSTMLALMGISGSAYVGFKMAGK